MHQCRVALRGRLEGGVPALTVPVRGLLQKLEQDNDDQYHNSAWADSGALKRSFQGLGNIGWRPK